MHCRRLARDDERTTANSEAIIYWATVIIMTMRLAATRTPAPIRRWGQRTDPPGPAGCYTSWLSVVPGS
jgi:hypothetical protein